MLCFHDEVLHKKSSEQPWQLDELNTWCLEDGGGSNERN